MSEKERKKKMEEEEEVKEMKRQKLDVEQIIETLKKNLCEKAIASAQQNGQDHATEAASCAKTPKEEVLYHELLCGLEELFQNQYTALLNWQCMLWVYSITLHCSFKVAYQFSFHMIIWFETP